MVVCRYLQCKEVSCHASLFGTGFLHCCWKCVLSMLKSQHTDSGSANLEYQLCSADTTIAYAAACQLRSWLHISTCPCAKPNIWDCPVHAGTYYRIYIYIYTCILQCEVCMAVHTCGAMWATALNHATSRGKTLHVPRHQENSLGIQAAAFTTCLSAWQQLWAGMYTFSSSQQVLPSAQTQGKHLE